MSRKFTREYNLYQENDAPYTNKKSSRVHYLYIRAREWADCTMSVQMSPGDVAILLDAELALDLSGNVGGQGGRDVGNTH